MNYFPFGEQWYILERFPLHSQATRLPLMEKGRMCLSRASQVSVQDTTFYGMHVPSPPQSSQPLWPCSWALLQHQLTSKTVGMGFSLTGWVWGQQCSNAESVLAVRACATGKPSNWQSIVRCMKKRKETTLPVRIHSWDYPTSKYWLHSSLIFPCSPPCMLFSLP